MNTNYSIEYINYNLIDVTFKELVITLLKQQYKSYMQELMQRRVTRYHKHQLEHIADGNVIGCVLCDNSF